MIVPDGPPFDGDAVLRAGLHLGGHGAGSQAGTGTSRGRDLHIRAEEQARASVGGVVVKLVKGALDL